ncbi:MAG: aldehyde ferredoxin oxidoreductase family protein [bacterium]|nr:aldehyde ferredoxin oxidoreductase family protein [bacterium]MCP4133018.1 aldehyde ferredoxin oxidoreductase family protein [bacterium]
MQEIIGTSNKVLEIDLTNKKFSEIEITNNDREMYLGGKGLGLKLIYDRMDAGIDPLGEDNMIAFMMGALMGTGAPCTGRFDAVTKSPLTGIMVSASCGGPFGMALKTSGWDGVIVKGKAKKPTYLVIDSKGVEFKDAKKIWGKDTQKAQESISNEGSGSVIIGPAGENLVRYANICSGHRFLGRGGMGAVMGSKNLKGIVAKGKEFKIVPIHKEKFDKYRKKAIKYINNNNVTAGTYRTFGTNANVNLNNAAGILPVRNFTGGSHGEAHKISGETIKEKHDTRFHTCKPCTILCGHKGNFGGKERAVPEYETVGLFGSNLEIFDPVVISDWNEICTEMGMDTISTAATIAWVMEAAEKGLFKSKLKFGSPDGISQTLKDIGNMKGTGKELAMGTRWLSKKYGGEDFAIQVKGMEMAAYDPRGAIGQGLSFAVANRGACHLASTIFALEAYFGFLRPYAQRGKHVYVGFAEDISSAVNSLHICQFTAFAFELEPPLIKFSPQISLNFLTTNLTAIAVKFMDISLWPELWSTTTGLKLNTSKFLKAGKRINALERYMNTREGISKKDDTLPGRLLNEGRKCDPKGRPVPLEKMLKNYYKLRGWDANGIPKDKVLKKLGIEKK